ncbi:MAG: hypothetical protein FXF47_09880 [Candidatus Mcinerneyibacterium aminivorans]|uniref:Permease n=1 Tax=Candidatus Mcinerneyibacterium aminivorans TaxID=2703815 RepID=A0A5D0MBC5_9BACT|nr:MAG: hypothetical protein FXF47_09880 [Candidatus Mcinerneyibacterium aminivorans]
MLKKIIISVYFLFIITSLLIGYQPGLEVGLNLVDFAKNMLKILPPAFILIGLFEVWVKKETIEKHLGENSSFMGFVWAIILAGTTVGGIYVAIPISYSLYKKGARYSVIFTYLGASAICRVPMTIFEATFLGIKFSLIRLLTSIPLVILSSILLEKFLIKIDYKMGQKD